MLCRAVADTNWSSETLIEIISNRKESCLAEYTTYVSFKNIKEKYSDKIIKIHSAICAERTAGVKAVSQVNIIV